MGTHSLSIQHVFNRGVRRSDIYHSDEDYRRFYNLLRWYTKIDYPYSVYLQRINQAKRFGVSQGDVYRSIAQYYSYAKTPVSIFAWAFMNNHFHMVISEHVERGITMFLHRISTAYATYFNRKYEYTGSLFESNYKSVEVTDERQLLYVIRYVHLNPVAAGLVDTNSVDDYAWSSWSEYRNPNDREILDRSLFDEFGISDEVVVQSVLDKKDTEDNEGYSNLLIG